MKRSDLNSLSGMSLVLGRKIENEVQPILVNPIKTAVEGKPGLSIDENGRMSFKPSQEVLGFSLCYPFTSTLQSLWSEKDLLDLVMPDGSKPNEIGWYVGGGRDAVYQSSVCVRHWNGERWSMNVLAWDTASKFRHASENASIVPQNRVSWLNIRFEIPKTAAFEKVPR